MPNDVKEIILRAARRLQIEAILVANKNVSIGEGPNVSFVRVESGLDVADGHIVSESTSGDFAITADVPLAARLVAKGLVVLDPRGELYSADSIAERLTIRDFMADLRASGVITGGPPPFDVKAKSRFASLFDRLLTRALREERNG
jgi:uncharacterized protein YaiI (UPF0178 family)